METNTEAGLFSRVGDSREIEGLLLPFGEFSRANLTDDAPVMFSASAVALPRDPSIVTLNDEHDRFNPLGRGVKFSLRDAGVVGRFAIANTDEGDAFLASYKDGTGKRKLSAELGSLVRNGPNAVRSRLTGAAVCQDGAFESAALFSLAPGKNVEFTTDVPASDEYSAPDRDNSSRTISEFTDSEGKRWRRTEEYSSKTTVEPITTDAETPADTNTETEGTLMGKIVPGGAAAVTPAVTLDAMFAAYAGLGDREPFKDSGALFALATLPDSGPAAQTIGQDTDRRGYLGELWNRAAYQRRFVPLVTPETLTDFRMTGWKWDTVPTMADYEGNAKEVPSNVVDTIPVDVVAKRLAGGHRLDRKYRDFGNTEVPASYIIKQTESYLRLTDQKVLAGLLGGATVTAPGASIPAGIAKGMAAIVDGALGVINSENRPAFAIVAADLWRDIVLMKENDKLAFLNAGFGLEEGDLDSFKIAPAPVGNGAGQIPAGRVLVGAREAYTFWELGQVPIRVEGVVPGNGADDLAAFGYWADLVNNALAIRSVQTAA